jgi:hypothetical protein
MEQLCSIIIQTLAKAAQTEGTLTQLIKIAEHAHRVTVLLAT